MAKLSLKHIYKVYPNGVKAVNDFCMEIADKEFIVFVGPSGCGKSTMLRMIAGLEDISAGELSIDDLVVNDVEPKDRDIAMVFQNYALYPHMTVYENIAFGLRARKMPNDEIHERVLHASEILGIKEYLTRKPKEMSGGQRQRVSLGRAIVRNPKVMLLDEPLSNLDAKLRTQMRAEILKLHAQLKTTFIYVTHDQVEAMTMGTRIVVMKNGFVQQIDTPKNLYLYPGNKFVAGFIGTPQMNFFEGTMKKNGDKVDIVFKYSDASISVPYEQLIKVRPGYLDGNKEVFIGVRAEDMTLEPSVVVESPYKIKVVVSHVEELGDESLVYGDINMGGDGYVESSTRVIIKTTFNGEFVPGNVYEAAVNVSKLHFFDKETEETIVPRLPEINDVECTVKEGKLNFSGISVQLPPALMCGDGQGKMLLPSNAISFDGDIKTNVVDCEKISDKYLVSFETGGRRMFAVTDTEVSRGEAHISIDFKRITLCVGETIIEPMEELVRLEGTFDKVKEKVVENKSGTRKTVKKVNFYLNINGVKFPSPEYIAQKIFATLSPRSVFSSRFYYDFTPYTVRIADSGIEGTVEGVSDYGKEKFLRVRVNDKTVNVFTEGPVTGKVFIMPDFNKAGIVEADRGIKLI